MVQLLFHSTNSSFPLTQEGFEGSQDAVGVQLAVVRIRAVDLLEKLLLLTAGQRCDLIAVFHLWVRRDGRMRCYLGTGRRSENVTVLRQQAFW